MAVVRISEFDIWRPGYGGAEVSIMVAGTTDLAPVFTDEALTQSAPNPQTLSSRSDPDGTNYGKFEFPLYTDESYFLDIADIEETGIQRPPLTSLVGEDASAATVTPTGSDQAITVADLVARQVYAANYGLLVTGESGSAATNTATINLAIAALTNGGEVILPSGKVKVNSLNVPSNIILCGQGKTSTILESILGATSFTITGNRAGFRKLTLDGNSLTADSVGILSVGNDETFFDEVMVKRFDTGMSFKGGSAHRWTDFSIENCDTGAKLHGDMNAGGGNNGDAFESLLWTGGKVTVCSTAGLDLSYEDALCRNINLCGVGFEDNTGTALKLNGSQFHQLDGCWFSGNTVNVDIQDDDAILLGAEVGDNQVIGVRFNGGFIDGGDFTVTDTAQEVILDTMRINNVEFNMNTPILNYLYLLNCTESAVAIVGEGTKILRKRQTANGEGFGITTGNVATKAWSYTLEPGQIVAANARVIGKQRNGTDRAVYFLACGAYRPASTLAYDTQTANYTVGDILTGASSGATARIVADSDSGATGTLSLTDIVGVFLDNETITGSSGGSAKVNGILSNSNVSLDTVGSTHTRTDYETDGAYNANFVANGTELEVQVTGNTNETVEWTVSVDVVTT